jgi:asparagine synthase (glutamine-hydrolysing)
MCGIWLLLSGKRFTVDQFTSFSRIIDRGPDYSETKSINLKQFPMKTLTLGFHRLSIMDVTLNGSQPFEVVFGNRTICLMCNGEIYNFEKLAEMLYTEHGVTMRSRSDCEVLPYLYIYYGFEKMLSMLDTAEFAIIIVDNNTETNSYDFYCTRDHTGVRPLYFGTGEDFICFSSQLDGIPRDTVTADQFPPGCYVHFTMKQDTVLSEMLQIRDKTVKYYDIDKHAETDIDRFIKSHQDAVKHVNTVFTDAVKSRLCADRPIAALLSGGLDSSLVCAIASKELKKVGKTLKTYSIGLPDSTDRYYAEKVAKFIGSDHTHIEYALEDFVDTALKIPGLISSYDTTTVRASTGQYLISKYISENTPYKVLLVGDGSDELCSGYMYFHKAPSAWDSHLENIRLVKDIHRYDGLRADRCVAINGIEVRLPFLDVKFVDTYLSIDPELRTPKMHNGRSAEKYLLRAAFDTGLLPDDCLWRPKEAFSDGVSGLKKSWFEMYQDYAESRYTDEEFERLAKTFSHYTPVTKEELVNRVNFDETFSENVAHIVPYRWVPLEKWVGKMTEPSARVLDVYDCSANDERTVGPSSD